MLETQSEPTASAMKMRLGSKWHVLTRREALRLAVAGAVGFVLPEQLSKPEKPRLELGPERRQFPANTPLSSDPRTEQIIRRNYNLLYANTTLEEAKLIGHGDYHEDVQRNAVKFNVLLRLRARDGDITLLEGEPYGRRIDKQSSIFTLAAQHDIIVRGWEHMPTYNQADRAQEEIIAVGKELRAARAQILRGTLVPEERINNLDRRQRNAGAMIERTTPQRNVWLNRSVEEALIQILSKRDSIQTLFVMAGRDHFLVNPGLEFIYKRIPSVILGIPEQPQQ